MDLMGNSARDNIRRGGLGERNELPFLGRVGKDLTGLELVNPTVQFEFSVGDGNRHGRVCTKVFQLHQNILLNRDVQQVGFGSIRILLASDPTCRLGM